MNVHELDSLLIDGHEGYDWYDVARDDIHEVAGGIGWSPRHLAALVAILSVRASPKKNCTIAARMVRGSTYGVMSQRSEAWKRYKETGVVTGPKVSAFYHNILHGNKSDRVTVDVWIAQHLFGYAFDKLTDRQRRAIQLRVARLARRHNLPVPATQAMLWVGKRRQAGNTDPIAYLPLKQAFIDTPIA